MFEKITACRLIKNTDILVDAKARILLTSFLTKDFNVKITS